MIKTAIALVLLVTAGQATELRSDMKDWPEEGLQALWAATREAQRCVSFWAIAAHCFAQTDDPRAPALADEFNNHVNAMTRYAVMMAPVVGMTKEQFTSFSTKVTAEMMDATNKDCANLSVLRVQYFNFCQILEKDPNARINQLFICIHTKAQSCPRPQ
jgi:hypothetical protein